MAYERLVEKLTKENLWLYILRMISENSDYPLGLKKRFAQKFGFEPATITFYIVLYRLRNEGLVVSELKQGRTYYYCTDKGAKELRKAVEFLESMSQKLEL